MRIFSFRGFGFGFVSGMRIRVRVVLGRAWPCVAVRGRAWPELFEISDIARNFERTVDFAAPARQWGGPKSGRPDGAENGV
ncbi:hypothetical protein ACIO93_20690 [Streptomyces sp. NPDC087903]|uniref:hypothetical protein n=1 Tax=Streptomyces sp. NPDC087903 TaxID=3365819 RepID=UPI003820EB06